MLVPVNITVDDINRKRTFCREITVDLQRFFLCIGITVELYGLYFQIGSSYSGRDGGRSTVSS